MAVAFDAASVATQASGSTLSWSHTCTGSNRLLTVAVHWLDTGVTVSSVTYAGTGMSSVGKVNNGTGLVTELFRLVAPATGANTVAITMSATATFIGGAISFTAVNF